MLRRQQEQLCAVQRVQEHRIVDLHVHDEEAERPRRPISMQHHRRHQDEMILALPVGGAADLGQLRALQHQIQLEHHVMQMPAAKPAVRDGPPLRPVEIRLGFAVRKMLQFRGLALRLRFAPVVLHGPCTLPSLRPMSQLVHYSCRERPGLLFIAGAPSSILKSMSLSHYRGGSAMEARFQLGAPDGAMVGRRKGGASSRAEPRGAGPPRASRSR